MRKLATSQLKELPIAAIEIGDMQPRKFFEEQSLIELASSLKEKGALQPVVVRPKNGGYEVIMGARRLKAAQIAQLKKYPAFVVQTLNDSEALEIALTENMQREDLTPFEEAWGILRLMKDFNYSAKDVCSKLNKSDTFVRSRIQLLQLPKEVQQSVSEGKLSMAAATNLTKLDTAEEQVKVAGDIIRTLLSRQQAKEKIIEQIQQPKKKTISRTGRSMDALKYNKTIFQIKRLQVSMGDINLEVLSLPARDGLKIELNQLKGRITEVIKEIDGMT
ncbi:MAG: ParB/RepB/Spo0J family partition protein [Candidatus Portnoybacteria bacterium]|nr:ParB/RepB/Spo0J family partition protein [Candidatus Portnoybacteria bacterium]